MIWGNGLFGKKLDTQREDVCQWQGWNIAFIDLIPRGTMNGWNTFFPCPNATGIEASWSQEDGILEIQCEDKNLVVSYDILPDSRSWSPDDKLELVLNMVVVERIKNILYTGPVKIDDSVEALVAKCGEDHKKMLLRVIPQPSVLKRVQNKPSRSDTRPNILIIFIDCAARNHFYRKLEQTVTRLETILNELSSNGPSLHQFFRYHAIGECTEPNTRVMWTSSVDKNESSILPPIWQTFYEAGYITTHTETACYDWSAMYANSNTSLYWDHELVTPFCHPDYYPADKWPFGLFQGPYSFFRRCLHGNNVHNYAFQYLNAMRKAYRNSDKPWFTLASFIEAHEASTEAVVSMDNDLADFLTGLKDDGVLENTVVFLMADHGLHMGLNYMLTQNGRIEHMNPLLLMLLPPGLSKQHPSLIPGLDHNEQGLLTHYEFHKTLKLLANGIPQNDEDGTWRKGTLFDETFPNGRTCAEAQIPEIFCQCK
jgi:hypothetical protein